MRKEWQVGVVIPAKNEQSFIRDVIDSIPDFVDKIVVINDGSTDKTQIIIEDMAKINDKIDLINLPGNGVGYAIDTGHQRLIDILEKPFVSVVMAGDGQMGRRTSFWVKRAEAMKSLRLRSSINGWSSS